MNILLNLLMWWIILFSTFTALNANECKKDELYRIDLKKCESIHKTDEVLICTKSTNETCLEAREPFEWEIMR